MHSGLFWGVCGCVCACVCVCGFVGGEVHSGGLFRTLLSSALKADSIGDSVGFHHHPHQQKVSLSRQLILFLPMASSAS